MKGRISIKEFVQRVKEELVEAQDKSGKPFYELTEVTLEISFALEAAGKAGFDLYVVEFGGEAKAQQTHKVSLKLTPLEVRPPVAERDAGADTAPVAVATEAAERGRAGGGGGGGGGGGLFRRNMPVYDKRRDDF